MTSIFANQALLPDGWHRNVRVTFAAGQILSVECQKDGRLRQVDDHRVDCLLAAPANLHSHGFQRAMAGLTEARGPAGDSFWTWRDLMYRFLEFLTPDHVQAITAFAQMEMLQSGYSACGEFHYLHHGPGGAVYDNVAEMACRIAAAADTTGIGLTLLPVHYQFGGCDGRDLQGGQLRFGNDIDRYTSIYHQAKIAVRNLKDDSHLGVAPHSPRAVALKDFQHYRSISDGPIHMHFAEQSAEMKEIESVYGTTPANWLLDNVDLDDRWCLIHGTQLDAGDITDLAATGLTFGLCPITEASLGDGVFDAAALLAASGVMGVGTDSNIQIGLSDEMRMLEYSQRLREQRRSILATSTQSTGRHIFDQITYGGARALGRKSGQVAPGYYADFIALDCAHIDLTGRDGDKLIDSFIFTGGDRMVSDVWAAGRHMVTQGQHIHADRITADYKAVLKELMGAL